MRSLIVILLLINTVYSIKHINSAIAIFKSQRIKTSKDSNLNNDILASSINTDVKVKKLDLNAFELCLCGAFATAFGDFCVHPIDTIKVTQQAAGISSFYKTYLSICAK